MTFYDTVWQVCDVVCEDAVKGFTDDVVEGLPENAKEVTLSKTENLLHTVTDGSTLSQERGEIVGGWERWEGVTILLPVVKEVELEWREEA